MAPGWGLKINVLLHAITVMHCLHMLACPKTLYHYSYCMFAHNCVSKPLDKLGWIRSSGLGGDNIMDKKRMDGQTKTDGLLLGQTDGWR